MKKEKISELQPKSVSKNAYTSAVNKTLTIVGIGASAGGLEALEEFLVNVPTLSGLAFVVVQHLDPNYEGMMPELLQRSTPMKVTQARNRMKVNQNCVYIIPPNKDMSILHGLLFLLDPVAPRGLRLPIDFFFRSLAADQKERAVGIILSGMGSDGTLGLRAIKENAGLSMVQSPTSAKYDSMPSSAVNAGLADIVVSAKDLPERLMAHLNHSHHGIKTGEEPKLKTESHSALEKIIILLRDRTGNDFSQYKQNTINRRIERRMGLHQIDKIAFYVRYLRENPQELDLLFKELLIGVTNFFRDQLVWEQFRSKALPTLLSKYPAGKEMRAWVPACSTGEEAYTLAMAFKETLDEVKPHGRFSLQIFATDLDEDAIKKARLAFYPSNIEDNVSPQRIARFFVKDGSGYRISKEIREMIIFAPQNIIMDPPFTKLDILTCRNLLIYLGPELQKRLIPLLHYALFSQGILMLGTSETVGSFSSLFKPVENKSKLYSRIDTPLLLTDIDFPIKATPIIPGAATLAHRTQPMTTPTQNIQDQADQILLQNYAPAAVMTNAEGDILYINGRTGKYIEPAAGKANWNIYAMAREGLRHALGMAIKKARHQTESVHIPNLTIGTNGGTQTINLTVQVITSPESLSGSLMLVFNDVPPPETPLKKQPTAGVNQKLMQAEIQQSHELMQSLREEMQSSQEELKSSNEELQSTNEELQSTNEELTTSKEEMQSLNEELQTVNTELQSKVEDLSWVNNDMENLLNSTEIATVFLDGTLRVRRFTNHATDLFKLIPSDVGRLLSDVVSNLDYAALHDDAREVLRTLVFIEKQVTTKDTRWFKVRIMPYRTQENVIDGVVITFVEITNSKQVEAGLENTRKELKKSLGDLERIFNLKGYLVCIASSEGTFKKVSPGFTETLGFSESELLAKPFVDFVHQDDKKATTDSLVPLARGIPVIKFLNRYICQDGSYKWLEWTARSFVNGGDIYATAYDVTERELTNETLNEALALLQGSYTDQTTELNTANALETVLNTTQSMLEKRLKDQSVELGQVKADLKSEQAKR
ncbi:MAG: chemotaxis protein methyltransferase CheR/two-component system CheB/CheR fusion protein [Pseudohongiellaceae bacterium]